MKSLFVQHCDTSPHLLSCCIVNRTLYLINWPAVGLMLPGHWNPTKSASTQFHISYQEAAGWVATCVFNLRSLCHGNGSAHLFARSSGAPAAAAHLLSVGSLSLTRVGRGQSVKGRANSCSVHANFRLRWQCRRQPGVLYRGWSHSAGHNPAAGEPPYGECRKVCFIMSPFVFSREAK